MPIPTQRAATDLRLQEEYEQWIALGRPDEMPAQPYVVTIRWSGDPDRGEEPYGPFPNSRIADQWVADCEEAASLGYELLQDAEYVIQRLPKPFDPHELMSDASLFQPGPAIETDPATGGPAPYDHDASAVRDVSPAAHGGSLELLTGHEYELTYRVPGQDIRRALMGFLGTSHGMLDFNARPRRGTQQLRPEWIVSAVDQGITGSADTSRRYVDRPAR